MATTSSRSIIASGFPADTNEDELTIYFQRRSISGGGDVEGVCMRNDGEAIVKFADPQVVPSVLQRTHTFDGQELFVKTCPVALEPIFEDSSSSSSSDSDESDESDKGGISPVSWQQQNLTTCQPKVHISHEICQLQPDEPEKQSSDIVIGDLNESQQQYFLPTSILNSDDDEDNAVHTTDDANVSNDFLIVAKEGGDVGDDDDDDDDDDSTDVKTDNVVIDPIEDGNVLSEETQGVHHICKSGDGSADGIDQILSNADFLDEKKADTGYDDDDDDDDDGDDDDDIGNICRGNRRYLNDNDPAALQLTLDYSDHGSKDDDDRNHGDSDEDGKVEGLVTSVVNADTATVKFTDDFTEGDNDRKIDFDDKDSSDSSDDEVNFDLNNSSNNNSAIGMLKDDIREDQSESDHVSDSARGRNEGDMEWQTIPSDGTPGENHPVIHDDERETEEDEEAGLLDEITERSNVDTKQMEFRGVEDETQGNGTHRNVLVDEYECEEEIEEPTGETGESVKERDDPSDYKKPGIPDEQGITGQKSDAEGTPLQMFAQSFQQNHPRMPTMPTFPQMPYQVPPFPFPGPVPRPFMASVPSHFPPYPPPTHQGMGSHHPYMYSTREGSVPHPHYVRPPVPLHHQPASDTKEVRYFLPGAGRGTLPQPSQLNAGIQNSQMQGQSVPRPSVAAVHPQFPPYQPHVFGQPGIGSPYPYATNQGSVPGSYQTGQPVPQQQQQHEQQQQQQQQQHHPPSDSTEIRNMLPDHEERTAQVQSGKKEDNRLRASSSSSSSSSSDDDEDYYDNTKRADRNPSKLDIKDHKVSPPHPSQMKTEIQHEGTGQAQARKRVDNRQRVSSSSSSSSSSSDDDDEDDRHQSVKRAQGSPNKKEYKHEGIGADSRKGGGNVSFQYDASSDDDSSSTDEPEQDTIEVTNLSEETTAELLVLYFESKRSGGGPVKNMDFTPDIAFVTFEHSSDVASVLRKKHKLNQRTLQVRVAPPLPPIDPFRVLVRNLSEKTTEDCLFFFMENVSRRDVEQVEYGLEEGIAMVTFDAVPKFDEMERRTQKKKLEGNFLHLSQVFVTNCVLVGGISPHTTEDTLPLYFESQRGGHAEVRDVEWKTEPGLALVYFEDYKDVDKVLQKNHILNKATLTVVPYYPAFGPPKSMKDFFIPKLPDPVTIEIHPAVAEFITHRAEHKASVEQEMNDVNAMIDWKSSREGTVEIDHTLTIDMKDIQTLVTTWSGEAVERAEMIFEKFTSKETKAAPELWPRLCERLQEMKNMADQSELLIDDDDKNNTVTFTGLALCVTVAMDEYQKIVKEIEEKMRREATVVTDKCPNIRVEKLRLLQMIGIKSKLPVDDVEVNIYPEENNITFKGQSSVVMETKLHILQTLSEVQERELKLASDILKLIKQGFGYVGKRLTPKCQVVVTVEADGLQITAMSRRDLDIAVGILEDMIIRNEIPVKQEWEPMLDDINFQLLISKLVSDFLIDIKSAKSKSGNPVIKFLGTEDGVDTATREIKQFMKDNAILAKTINASAAVVQLFFAHHQSFIDQTLQGLRDEKVKIKPARNGLEVTGTSTGVSNASVAVEAILSSFVTEEMTIDKPGARKCFKQGDTTNIQWLSLIEKEHKCAINVKCTRKDVGESRGAVAAAAETIDIAPQVMSEDLIVPQLSPPQLRRSNSQGHSRSRKSQSSNSHSGRSDKITTPEGIKISLKKGDITKQQADVLVNTCNSNLELTGGGGVSGAFGNAGGAKLQQYCDAIGGANAGDVVQTKAAGSLECQAIYHAVTPSSSGNHGQTVCDIVHECLTMAHRGNHKSVAFPAIGTGNLSYPRDVVAQSMYDEIFRFSQQNPNTSLKKIYLVVFDPPTVQAFQMEVGQRHGVPVPPPANIPTAYASRHRGLPHILRASQQRAMHSSVSSKQALQRRRTLAARMMSRQIALPASSPSPGQQTTSIGGIRVEVQQGDITQETTDVIVNCTSQNISSGGGVTKALINAGGSVLRQACQQYTQQQAGSVVSTVGGNLSCQNVYHLVNPPPQNLQDSILKCLQMADNSGMSSLAFPAVGTGSHGTSAQQCAQGLLGGILKFTQQGPPGNLQLVRITVFQQNQLPVFHAEMNNFGTGMVSFASPWAKLKTAMNPNLNTSTTASSVGNPTPASSPAKKDDSRKWWSKLKDVLKNVGILDGGNEEPVTLVITVPDKRIISDIKDAIDKFLENQTSEKALKNRMIGNLSKEELDFLVKLGKSSDVTVEKDGTNDVLKLCGSTSDVLLVFSEISDFLQAKKDEQAEKEKAELQQKNVQWYWFDKSCNHMVAYDAITNMTIEDAYEKKKAEISYELDDKGKRQLCKVNFQKMEESILGSSETHQVHREDLHTSQITLKGSVIPSHWDPQPLNNNQPITCHRVSLPPGHAEYQKVQSAFSRSGGGSAVSIERIQNPHLWQQYCAQKDKMNVQNKTRGANEMYLFHGTGEASINNINEKGFNRSFSGRAHGTALGNGTYFASSSGTSMGYSSRGPSGYRYMYYAKVLVGEYTQGRGNLVIPPAKHPSNPFDVYDTTVNNTSNPSVFVIFNDNQGYPEYLITF